MDMATIGELEARLTAMIADAQARLKAIEAEIWPDKPSSVATPPAAAPAGDPTQPLPPPDNGSDDSGSDAA